MNFGKRLKLLIEEKKMSAYQVALGGGISASIISRYLGDENANPSLDIMQRLAKGLGISLSYLLGETAASLSADSDTLIINKFEYVGQEWKRTEKAYLFPKDVMKDQGAYQPEDFMLIKLDAEDMAPVLNKGDLLLCWKLPYETTLDKGNKEWQHRTTDYQNIKKEGIYLFKSHGLPFCAHLKINYDGTLSLWNEKEKERMRMNAKDVWATHKVMYRLGAV